MDKRTFKAIRLIHSMSLLELFIYNQKNEYFETYFFLNFGLDLGRDIVREIVSLY